MTPTVAIFNPLQAPLDGWNLVEASAGTGKTYSIALLTLRLLLEQGHSVREILIVTYTNAATAELQERIRKFIREARTYTSGKSIANAEIKTIVDNAHEKLGAEELNQLLKDAWYLIDELQIFTIHAFCQYILSEFAIETRQFINATLVEEMDYVYEKLLHHFWRKEITTLPLPLLKQLIATNTLPELSELKRVINNSSGGKHYVGYDIANVALPLADRLATGLQQLLVQEDEAKNLRLAIQATLDSNPELYQKEMGKRGNTFAAVYDNPIDPGTKTWDKNKSKYPQLVADIEAYGKSPALIAQRKMEMNRQIYYEAIDYVRAEAEAYKERLQLHSFDDFINNLHQIVTGTEGAHLISILQKRYKAVFIDEFQDTDVKQFEIFEKIFSESDAVMYFIGDPKQSIYAFRGADVDSYLLAKNKMHRHFSMNTNYRSAGNFLDSLNEFLKPTTDFDTFHYSDAADRIDYSPVQSPVPDTKPKLLLNNVPTGGLDLFIGKNKDEINDGVVQLVSNLLHSGQYSLSDGNLRPVKPSDIAVLCRWTKNGFAIQRALQRANISSVITKESKILESEEAIEMIYLLEAIEKPGRANIARMMIGNFMQHSLSDIESMDEDALINLLTETKVKWETQGPYPALTFLAQSLGIKQKLLASGFSSDDKVLANFNHLLEIINRAHLQKKLSLPEMRSWLATAITNKNSPENEYLQRLETDDQSLKITTIHKSKGLEYNIVICPDLDLENSLSTNHLHSIKDRTAGLEYFGKKDEFDEDQQERQQIINEQENRRLLYVAATRAVSQLYVFRNSWYSGKRTSTLSAFVEGKEFSTIEALPTTTRNDENIGTPAILTSSFPLHNPNWAKLSYTYLSGSHETSDKPRPVVHTNEYDNFIHHQLGRGAQIGIMLHEVFETIKTDKPEFVSRGIEAVAKKYAYLLNSENAADMLEQLVVQVMNAEIRIGETSFKLKDVRPSNQIAELEFDFPISDTQLPGIRSLTSDEAPLQVRHSDDMRPYEGIMNGKIDLFFEYGGKYYVLDWKSNYLGPDNSFYSHEHCLAAMNENNYHLQYLVYSLAVKKFLESKIAGFDMATQFGGAIYIFLRGARAGSSAGVYTRHVPVKDVKALEKIIV